MGLVSWYLDVSIQQLAAKPKESRIKLDKAKCQLCTDIVIQDPSLGTLVPPYSEVHVVSVQKLEVGNYFLHSVVELSFEGLSIYILPFAFLELFSTCVFIRTFYVTFIA